MSATTAATNAMRIQLCPASAMAAVASGDNERAKAFIPARFCAAAPPPPAAGGELQARESREDYLKRVIDIWGAHPEQCPAEVKDKVERWLIATGGTELRKARSLEAALAAVSHLACRWTTDREEIERMSEILREERKEKAEEEMEALVKNAHEVSSRILEEARRERERILRDACRERELIMDIAYRERERIMDDASRERERVIRREFDRLVSRTSGSGFRYRSRSPDQRGR